MISIIISECQDNKYLTRCLNSINRQTYKEWEIIRIGDKGFENLEDVLKYVNGEYCLFCNASTVLAPNTLASMVESFVEENSILCGNLLLEQNNSYVFIKNDYLFFTGKLIPTSLLKDSIQKLKDDGLSKENHSMLYMIENVNGNIRKIEAAYIYETDKKILDKEMDGYGDDLTFEKLLEFYKNTSVKDCLEPFFLDILKNTQMHEIKLKRSVDIINAGPCSYEFRYTILDDYIVKAFKECQTDNNPALYDQIKLFLMKEEDDEIFFEIILQKLGLNKKQYECIKTFPLNEYMFFKDKVRIEENNVVNSISAKDARTIVDSLDNNKKLLEKLEKTVLNLQINMPKLEIHENVTPILEGPVLADYIVEKYRNGELGLGTILKAVRAWIAFKIKR